MKEHMEQILKTAYNLGVLDIHITVGKPPMVRKTGEMVPLPNHPPLTGEHTKNSSIASLPRPSR